MGCASSKAVPTKVSVATRETQVSAAGPDSQPQRIIAATAQSTQVSGGGHAGFLQRLSFTGQLHKKAPEQLGSTGSSEQVLMLTAIPFTSLL
jgi:hypothetical protein